MKHLVIFDYDGTIADTSPGICHCYNKAAAEMGYPSHRLRADFFGVIGGPLEHGFLTLWPDMPEEQASYAVTRYRELYAQEGRFFPAPLYKGMRETLEALKRQGLCLAVATLKHEQFIHGMLRDNKIESLFDAVCAYRSNESKSDLLWEACRITGIPPAQSLLVGDSAFDGIGAQLLFMDFAAVLYGWGFRTEEETIPYSPSAILHFPKELESVLR